MELESIISG